MPGGRASVGRAVILIGSLDPGLQGGEEIALARYWVQVKQELTWQKRCNKEAAWQVHCICMSRKSHSKLQKYAPSQISDKNLPSNEGDEGSTLVRERKILHATGN